MTSRVRGTLALGLGTLVLLATASPSLAELRDVDTTYGDDGYVRAAPGGSPYTSEAILIESGPQAGKLLVAGVADRPKREVFVARFTADGALDEGFADDGYLWFGAGQGEVSITSAIGLDAVAGGHFLLAGIVDEEVFAASFDADGELDDSYGDSGIARIVVPCDQGYMRAAGTYPPGSALAGALLVTGPCSDPGQPAIALRLTPDGDLDTSFANDGIKKFDLLPPEEVPGLNPLSVPEAVEVAADGDAYIAGWAHTIVNSAVAKLDSSGSLDSAFAGDGRRSIEVSDAPCPYWDTSISDVEIDPASGKGGRVLLGGSNLGCAFAVVALNASDGEYDASYGEDGRAVHDIWPSFEAGQELILGADGSSMLVGSTEQNPNLTGGPPFGPGFPEFMTALRLDPHGALDPAFSLDGVALADFGERTYAQTAVVTPDGGVIAVGGTRALTNPQPDMQLALAKFRAAPIDPPPETSFQVPAPTVFEWDEGVKFEVRSDEPLSRYECSLDGMGFESCGFELDLGVLAQGEHRLRARAIDLADQVDPTPAVHEFRVEPPPPLMRVLEISEPRSVPGLLNRGVSARVRCSRACDLKLIVRVSDDTKRSLGLSSNVLARTRASGAGRIRLAAHIDRGVSSLFRHWDGGPVDYRTAIDVGERAS